MKRTILIAAMIIATTTAFSQGKKAKHAAKPITAVPTIHDLKIGDNDLNVVIGAASVGIHNYLMTTDVPAKDVAAYEQRFQRYLETLAGQQYQWQQNDKLIADSLAKAKLRQDSLNNAKPKK